MSTQSKPSASSTACWMVAQGVHSGGWKWQSLPASTPVGDTLTKSADATSAVAPRIDRDTTNAVIDRTFTSFLRSSRLMHSPFGGYKPRMRYPGRPARKRALLRREIEMAKRALRNTAGDLTRSQAAFLGSAS